MIIMALDHVRDFNHAGTFDPEDLSKTTAVLFFTRWITHICAPTFMLTGGFGAYFWLGRHQRTTGDLTWFLVKRGLWLVLLELTVFRFVINLSLVQGPILLVVLWALGCSMIALGLLVRLPLPVNAAVSLGAIVLHNALDPVRDLGWWWNILHQRGAFPLGPLTVVAAYPLIPWFGVMGAGYCLGSIMKQKRPEWLVRLGLGLFAGYIVLRAVNVYGDPVPWDGSFLSFFRCTKYPPSLEYLLMTLGPAVALLGLFSRRDFSKKHPLIVFGRTPLFYFVGHLYLARIFGAMISPGVGLGGVYLIWIGVVVAMYPLCVWFAGVKEKHNHWALSYL